MAEDVISALLLSIKEDVDIIFADIQSTNMQSQFHEILSRLKTLESQMTVGLDVASLEERLSTLVGSFPTKDALVAIQESLDAIIGAGMSSEERISTSLEEIRTQLNVTQLSVEETHVRTAEVINQTGSFFKDCGDIIRSYMQDIIQNYDQQVRGRMSDLAESQKQILLSNSALLSEASAAAKSAVLASAGLDVASATLQESITAMSQTGSLFYQIRELFSDIQQASTQIAELSRVIQKFASDAVLDREAMMLRLNSHLATDTVRDSAVAALGISGALKNVQEIQKNIASSKLRGAL